MILCAGEALIDMIPAQTLTAQGAFVPHDGGAVFNTAIALGRLGEETGMLTGLSRDMFGQQLVTGLAASNVNTELSILSDRPTTLAFVKITDGQASYVFYDENSAGRMIAPEDLPVLPETVGTLYFGGISLACEPGADTYAALLEREGDTRAVMIDPNIRPGFIQDEARYRQRLEAMMARCDILKVSDEDLDWMSPAPATMDEKVRKLQAMGPAVVIVTLGREGAQAWLADGSTVKVAAHLAEVVDTVGAGDTFNAGVLAQLSQMGCLSKSGLRALTQTQARQMLDLGARVASITVSRAGANAPWREELTAA
ncbi:carbohydrate kinase [Rhodobacteraceae bacterium]|nr:carbohydrate kinase [Paracoccaceae bacterium]